MTTPADPEIIEKEHKNKVQEQETSTQNPESDQQELSKNQSRSKRFLPNIFSKRKRPKTDTNETIAAFIGSKIDLEGVLSFEGTIRIDSKLKGTIKSTEGTLIVGESAAIEADIYIGSGIIMGAVTGTIWAKNRVEVYKPARITGDIHAPQISLDAGVTFNGKCDMDPPEHFLQKDQQETDSADASASDSKVK